MMLGYINEEQMKRLKETLNKCFYNVSISDMLSTTKDNSENMLNIYLAAKNIEGCSNKTINYYKSIIEDMIKHINKQVIEITTEDLRTYLSEYQQTRDVSRVTLD